MEYCRSYISFQFTLALPKTRSNIEFCLLIVTNCKARFCSVSKLFNIKRDSNFRVYYKTSCSNTFFSILSISFNMHVLNVAFDDLYLNLGSCILEVLGRD